MPGWIVKPAVLIALGAALVLGLLAGGWWLHHSGYAAGQDDEKEARNLADLEAFKTEAGRLSGLSIKLATQVDSISSALPTVTKEYHETVVKSPLPASCVIDPGRLRSIQDAIAKAAAAGQRGPAVPSRAGVR
jgi:hypothetical protein